MTKKITQEQLEEIIDQVRQETKIDLTASMEEAYGPKRDVELQVFIDNILPRLLATTFANATNHAEYVIHGVLHELDLIEKDD